MILYLDENKLNNKKVMIKESSLGVLLEGLSNILYHFTSLGNGYEICKDGVLYLQSAYAKDADNYDKKRKFYLSCTRMRNVNFGYSRKFNQGGVRIVFDGDLLSTKFKGKPMMYWKGLGDKFHYYEHLPKSTNDLNDRMVWYIGQYKRKNPNATEDDIKRFVEYNFNRDAQEHIANESEDRLFSYEPVIYDVYKYIKSIDVLIVDFENDAEKMKMAQAFKWATKLRSLVHVYDSVEEFNNPNGKDANDKIEYESNNFSFTQRESRGVIDALKQVVYFIAYANPRFSKKNFPREVAALLKKYELSEFSGLIGTMTDEFNRIYSVRQIADNLDSCRRNLSDTPNKQTYKIVKMMTDYFLSIGADSFREAFLKKCNIADDYYGHNGNVYDRIDTNVKYDFFVINRHILCLYPEKDRFCNAVGWDDETCRAFADSYASEAMYNDGYNNKGSKNYNSMFQYIYKLFRKGSVMETYQALKKIGFSDEFLDSWNISLKVKSLDYWDAVRYDTVNTARQKNGDYDYMTIAKQNDREIEEYFKNRQKISK